MKSRLKVREPGDENHTSLSLPLVPFPCLSFPPRFPLSLLLLLRSLCVVLFATSMQVNAAVVCGSLGLPALARTAAPTNGRCRGDAAAAAAGGGGAFLDTSSFGEKGFPLFTHCVSCCTVSSLIATA